MHLVFSERIGIFLFNSEPGQDGSIVRIENIKSEQLKPFALASHVIQNWLNWLN